MGKSRTLLIALAGCILAAFGIAADAAQTPGNISVSAGGFDRRGTPVMVSFQQSMGRGGCELVDDSGSVRPLQMLDDRHGVFILSGLKAGQTRTYAMRAASDGGRLMPGVKAKRHDGTIEITVAGKPAFIYQGDKTPLPQGYASAYQRGGYIYPVLTPSGLNVADDYPPNHKHHHGIWAAWTKTDFEGRHPDFWNMGDRTGTVETIDFGHEFSGPVCGGLIARHKYVDLSCHPPIDALNETWQVTAYGAGTPSHRHYFLFDLTVTQTCAGRSPLTLEQYRYGGIAFRGAREWNGITSCDWLTSDGKDRMAGNEARVRWVRASGNVRGRSATVAILDASDNFRFPQPIRIFPDQPYCVFSPSNLGAFQITPAKPFVARYRFVIADGVISRNELDGLWNDYARPPQAQWAAD